MYAGPRRHDYFAVPHFEGVAGFSQRQISLTQSLQAWENQPETLLII